MSRLKDKYLSEVVKGLQEKYNYKNVMQIPKVTKVVINNGRWRSCYPTPKPWTAARTMI